MGYSEEKLQKIWEKGRPIPGYSADIWRHDACGAVMRRDGYGQQTEHGWNVDHIHPASGGGSEDLSNLRPLQWENNTRKQDGTLQC